MHFTSELTFSKLQLTVPPVSSNTWAVMNCWTLFLTVFYLDNTISNVLNIWINWVRTIILHDNHRFSHAGVMLFYSLSHVQASGWSAIHHSKNITITDSFSSLQYGVLPGRRAELHSVADESHFRLDSTSPNRSHLGVPACYGCFLPRHLWGTALHWGRTMCLFFLSWESWKVMLCECLPRSNSLHTNTQICGPGLCLDHVSNLPRVFFFQFTMFICCAVIIAIIQYCNFCQLSYWMRSTLATLVGLALLSLLFISPCRYDVLQRCNRISCWTIFHLIELNVL